MKISKIREVKTPVRGTSLSAGIDFFVPRFDSNFVNDFLMKNSLLTFIDGKILLEPNDRVLIPSGIRVNFEGESKVLIAFNKSGVSVNKGLDILACVIDQDYQGEIHLSLVNASNKDVFISPNDKIAQFIMLPVFYEKIEVVSDDILWDKDTERGFGGFGSTGK